MGADGIVGLFPGARFAMELADGKRKGSDLVELLGISAVGALDPAVEFGRAGRQDKELDATLLTGPLEAGRELAPAIHLQGPQRQGSGKRVRQPAVGSAFRRGDRPGTI
jgi:hypothetical protein